MVGYINRIIVTVLCVGMLQVASAQSSNEECDRAIDLGQIVEYCSMSGEYSTVGVSESVELAPPCWGPGPYHDIWFAFTPAFPGVDIQYISEEQDIFFSSNLVMALYTGPCDNLALVECAEGPVARILEIIREGLTIGLTYYIRLASEDDLVGGIQLCIDTFVPSPAPESDCRDAVVLCDQSTINVLNLNSPGNVLDEFIAEGCTEGASAENASSWYQWTCDQSGTLEFTLNPNHPTDEQEDLDFIVYELPGGLDDCANRIAIRCMLSGANGINNMVDLPSSMPCFGPTGLMAGDPDTSEAPGCSDDDNSFLSPINMVSGTSYMLVVNNFSNSGFGYEMSFGGTGTFLGPDPDFLIESVGVFECDDDIIFTDNSVSVLGDDIVSWSWNFGEGAIPPSLSGQGPHPVTYVSFGNKSITLTVESSRGCLVTAVLDQYLEPCCDDAETTLDLTGDANDILCAGELGSVFGSGEGGFPFYQYSVDDDVNFINNSFFDGLEAGDHTLYVQDRKGCIDSIPLFIDMPPPLSVNIITPDTTIVLGETLQIEAEYGPIGADVTISWDPSEGLSCSDCLNPIVQSPGSTTFVLTIEDANGCIVREDITITTTIVRPIFPPNIFTPNNDGNNDFFTLGFGPQVRNFLNLKVYDRWGNLVYDGENLPINDFSVGWNGRFKGELVNPGVFAWIAEVEFIDDVKQFYTGSITVYR